MIVHTYNASIWEANVNLYNIVRKKTKEETRWEWDAWETEITKSFDTKISFIINEVICWLLINILLFKKVKIIHMHTHLPVGSSDISNSFSGCKESISAPRCLQYIQIYSSLSWESNSWLVGLSHSKWIHLQQ